MLFKNNRKPTRFSAYAACEVDFVDLEVPILFLHFGPSKPPKLPKTPQILSQNRAKTTGSNDLGPMPNHLFSVKITIARCLSGKPCRFSVVFKTHFVALRNLIYCHI